MTTNEPNRPVPHPLRAWSSGAEMAHSTAQDACVPAQGAVLDGVKVGRQQAARIVNDVLQSMTRGYRTRRSLRRLHSLDDRVLRDIGISRGEVVGGLCGIEFEYGRPSHDSN